MEKSYTDENEIISWHLDHAKWRTIKGINFVTTIYSVQEVAIPMAFEIISKTKAYVDEKTRKKERRSEYTKNEHYRRVLQVTCKNKIPFAYVLNDLWFASAENMCFVKLDLQKKFIISLKSNCKAALSAEQKS
jgi:hypothetical protein